MNRFIGATSIIALIVSLGDFAGAGGDKPVQDILNKAIKALGGEEKLGKVEAFSFKAKGTVNFGDNENPFASQTTVQDLDHFRREFEAEFGGNKFRAVTIVNGDKGWRFFGDNTTDLDKDGIANEKRNAYLHILAISILPLRKGFLVEVAPETKVADKAALGVKATSPDGKDTTLYFDKESGLPIKQVAKLISFQGMEVTEETIYGNYKDFDGIKRATKIESKRDGQKYMDQVITEFKLLNKVDPKMFDRPE